MHDCDNARQVHMPVRQQVNNGSQDTPQSREAQVGQSSWASCKVGLILPVAWFLRWQDHLRDWGIASGTLTQIKYYKQKNLWPGSLKSKGSPDTMAS